MSSTREHHRAQLRLPVRLRWTTLVGHKTEICETIDISRGGLLLASKEPHAPGVALWVTFPYDSSLPDGQLELPACVTRCSELLELLRAANAPAAKEEVAKINQIARVLGLFEVPATFALAVHLEQEMYACSNGDGHQNEHERRAVPRRPLSLPVRVRPEHMPWFEEAMTLDVSSDNIRFLSSRVYEPSDRLLISFPFSTSAPWPTSREISSLVMRVDPVPRSCSLAVTVRRVP